MYPIWLKVGLPFFVVGFVLGSVYPLVAGLCH